MKQIENKLDKILNKVKKPITYTGNEVNAVHKELSDDTIRFCLAFPDLYEVGMSHLGLKILYSLLNEQEDVWAERTFAPWTDMEEQMIENEIPLYALESLDPVKDFDFLGFSLQYEMSYTNVLNMLKLAGLALRSEERSEDDPIVIAGGSCAYNPEPLAEFIDLFVIGEAEEAVLELTDLYRKLRKTASKEDFLREAAKIEGIYVPRFYITEYNEDGTLKSFEPNTEGIPKRIKKRIFVDENKSYFPEAIIVPYSETVHDRISYEIFRGCPHGCRFCQAGQVYKPVREKNIDTIENQIDQLIKNTGYDEISLSSLSSGDYSKIETLITDLLNRYEDQKVKVSLPSLRIDSLSIEMLKEMEKVHKSGITLAPEAGTQRLRDVINKNVTEEDLLNSVSLAFQEGWGRIKLYFMMGLPTETDEDIAGIADLGQKVINEFYNTKSEKRNRNVQLVISTSCFVPKPFTAFQWVGQNQHEDFVRKQKYLKENIKSRKIRYNWHDSSLSFLEAIFSRGDRRLAKVLEKAVELGAKFDSWSDYYDEDLWMRAFEETEIDPNFYATRERTFEEVLPWDFIDIGVTKNYLWNEYQKAIGEEVSISCKFGCENCGMLAFSGDIPSLCLRK